jgi:hypothetical protein
MPNIKKYFPQLFHDANDFLSKHQQLIQDIKKKIRKDFNFDFKSQIGAILLSNKEYTVCIGASIKAKNDDYEILSYYFMLHDCAKVIRKFHFDFAPEYINKRARHPIFHLQYPGEFPIHLQNLKLEYDHLVCSLSEPRISFRPMSLALTLNMIFKEFQNEQTYKVVEDSTWRELIKTNEDHLLKPYFNKCNTFFSGSGIKLFTNDFCYGSV